MRKSFVRSRRSLIRKDNDNGNFTTRQNPSRERLIGAILIDSGKLTLEMPNEFSLAEGAGFCASAMLL